MYLKTPDTTVAQTGYSKGQTLMPLLAFGSLTLAVTGNIRQQIAEAALKSG